MDSDYDEPVDEPSGPPYRAIAMVLLTAVVIAVAIGLVQLFNNESDDQPVASSEPSATEMETPSAPAGSVASPGGQAPNTAPGQAEPGAPVPAPPADGQVPAPGAAEPAPPAEGQVPAPGEDVPPPPAEQAPQLAADVPVNVYNNSVVNGLAGRTGDQLRGSGYNVQDVTNLPASQGVVPQSAAYYGPDPVERQIAEEIAAELGIDVQPRPADLAIDTPGVIVVVTQDLQQ